MRCTHNSRIDEYEGSWNAGCLKKLKYFQFVLVHDLLTLYQPSEMTLYVR